MPHKESFNIIALLSKKQYVKGKYVLSINVVQKEKADSLITAREGRGYVQEECFMETGISPVIDIEVASKGDNIPILFEVSGALKPKLAFIEGENQLEFTGENECQKIQVLTRNTDDSSSIACITFFHSGKVLHRVFMDEIPCQDGRGGVETGIVDTFQRSLAISKVNLKTDSDKQALPGSLYEVTTGSEEIFDDKDHRLVLCDKSLNVLAAAIGPDDANRLFVGLGMSNTFIRQAHVEHPNDVVQRHFQLLQRWQQQNTEGGTESLYNSLLQEMEAIGRNDIKLTIERVDAQKRILTAKDFDSGRTAPVSKPTSDSLNSSFCDTSARGRILSNESLHVLASALGPQDGNSLFAGLEISDTIVKQAHADHHGVVDRQYQLLIQWRKRNIDFGTNHMYESLLQQLQAVGRNDIKWTLEEVEKLERKLEAGDFDRERKAPVAKPTSDSLASSFCDTSARGLILNNESLMVLAAALSPHDINRLVVFLGIPDATVKQADADHHYDVVHRQFQLLTQWRKRNTDFGTEHMYNYLLKQLNAVGRNDLKFKIEEAVAQKRTLNAYDFNV